MSKKVEGSHIAIDTLAWLIEGAFNGDPAQSLIANLHDLQEDDWTALQADVPRDRRMVVID